MIEISNEDADKVCAVVRKLLEDESKAYEEGKKKLSELEAANDKLKNTPFFTAVAEKLMKEAAEMFCNDHLKIKAELTFVLSLMYTGSEKKA